MNLAALDSERLWQPHVARRVNWEGLNNAGAVLARMRAHDIDILHVHASALPRLGLPAQAPAPPAPGERAPIHPWFTGQLPAGRLERALTSSLRTDGREILIGAYQGGSGDPFAGAADGRELLQAHLAYSDALDWQFRNSANVTGWKLLHLLPRRHDLSHPEHPPDLDGQVEIPYGAWTPAQAPARGLPWVHAWDVNGQRLAACSRLPLGLSGLHERPGCFPALVESKLPGYHLVERVHDPFPGVIPPIFGPGWHTTPRVKMATDLGIPVQVSRSWVWEDHTAYLNAFYDRMRKARSSLLERGDPPAQIALAALKQTYLQPLGRLHSRRTSERDPNHYRPSWYDHIIGAELARQYLRLHQLAQLGCPVIAVYFDTIIIESDRPEPDSGATLGVLEVSQQLGKFKSLGTLPGDTAREILYDQASNPVGRLVKALKAAPEGGHPQAREQERCAA